MAEIITCPACQRKLQVPESFFGQLVQCPDCAHRFVADPHAQGVQSNAPPAVSSALPEPERLERPSRRRREFDDRDDFDDDFDDMRPLIRRGSGVPHRGGVILALGIIALVIFPYSTIVCGPLAWVMGNADLTQIRAGRMDQSGEGMVQAGRVLGIISTILMLTFVVFGCGCFGLMVMTAPR